VRILLDTNVLLRSAIRTDVRHPQVTLALERPVQGGWEPCIGVQNVVEFWVVATRPVDVNGLGLSPEQARQGIGEALRVFLLLRDPPDLLERWLDLCTRYSVSGRPAHDARLVA
jgi:hypothetical protein